MFDTRKLLPAARQGSPSASLVEGARRGSGHAFALEQRSHFERKLAQGPPLTRAPRTGSLGTLELSRPDDPAEREADAVASRATAANTPQRGDALRSVDLGAVRIHADETAARAAHSVGAEAFTVGRDVFFDRGRYEPGTPRGDELILHELAHVAQQRSAPAGGGLAVQRRVGKYPNEPDSDQYSVLKPKRLNPQGPFSASVLELISRSYVDTSGTGGRSNGELILTILESSPTFVAMAKALDQHYADDSLPNIWVGFEFRGSMFVPKGQPFPTLTHFGFNTNPSVEVTERASKDLIFIDPSARPKINYPDTSSSAGADEQRAVAFADVLIHETIHAFRHAQGLSQGGLKGALTEELQTRLGTRKVLQELEKTTKNKDVASEAHAAAGAVTAGGVTLRDVAQSLVSGDSVTYLEKFYLDEATSVFLSGYAPEQTPAEHALGALWPPTSATLQRMPDIRSDFAKALGDLSTPKPKPPPPAPSPPVTAAPPAGSVTKTPPAKAPSAKRPAPKAPPAKKVAPAWLLGGGDKRKLEALMNDRLTLADLRIAERAARKLKGDAERALFYYVLLVRTRELAVTLAHEHEQATAAPGSKASTKLCTELAARLLGIKGAYNGL